MGKLKIGIIGTSDIALRRFLPALMKCDDFEYVGVASREYSKTEVFIEKFGGRGYAGYESLVMDSSIDVVYIPLPPALHYEWAMRALKAGKHVLLEKPFTTKFEHSEEIIEYAKSRNLAVLENYMFVHHSQLKKIKEIINDGVLGEVRLYRMAFGFPKRPATDFRYNRDLGGGALLDCGGYPIRLATDLLGTSVKITASKLNYTPEWEVDIYGSASIENENGEVAQITYGMDNSYRCELEVWGSKASLFTNRIFTAGDEFNPEIIIKYDTEKILKLDVDDQFLSSIRNLYDTVNNESKRLKNYEEILLQAYLIEQMKRSN